MTKYFPEGAVAQQSQEELEAFRQRWRQEVSARSKRPETTSKSSTNEQRPARRRELAASLPLAGPSTARPDLAEEVEPRAYHDLEDPEARLKLGSEGQKHDRDVGNSPSSALEHYERAVEKETQGQLGDSLRHYRTAFKLDDGVHEVYKKKHFPPSSFVKYKPTNPNPSNLPVTVPGTAHHSLHGSGSGVGGLSSSLKQLMEAYSDLRIEAAPPPTSISPQEPCRLAEMPEEILGQILSSLGVEDVAAFGRVAQVCRRLAYLVLTEEAIWKRIATGEEVGFGAMHYKFACDIEGFSLEANDSIARFLGSYDEADKDAQAAPVPDERETTFSALTDKLLHSSYASSWRQMFRARPRIRFNGCYISTVNYTRPGAASTNTLTWGTPVHVVTYFRYLRFFRDGTAISLLTTNEPVDVVHHLTKEHLHKNHNNTLPSSVMKDALRGRWRLSGPSSNFVDPTTSEPESEGDVHVETEGVVPKYTYKMLFGLTHAGKATRNNKLAWKGFWSYNRLTDDWGEFGLKNDRAYYWSRVKSYGTGY